MLSREGGPLQQPEQILPESEDKLGILERWFKHQGIVDEVFAERERQHDQWGVQDIPFGTSQKDWAEVEAHMRAECQRKTADGTVTFLDVLLEEVFEAAAEEDPAKLRDELIQVIAVGFQIVEAIDRRATATEGIG
jgi:hypothetical protein